MDRARQRKLLARQRRQESMTARYNVAQVPEPTADNNNNNNADNSNGAIGTINRKGPLQVHGYKVALNGKKSHETAKGKRK